MDRVAHMHAWTTFALSTAIIIFFTFSVALLSHGLLTLVASSAVLVMTGAYCMTKYSNAERLGDFKLLALLNMSVILGFVPGVGIRSVGAGVLGSYFWLSLVTINMAFSLAMIIAYGLRLKFYEA